MNEKKGVVRYVNICKKLFVVFACAAIPAFMVSLVFAFSRVVPFYFIAPAIGVLFLVVYSAYQLNVSMGTVLGIEVTDKVVHLKTKRKVYTYDVRSGCVAVKTSARKFVATFRTQNSEDKFTFPRRVLFSKYYEEQFTEDEIRLFFPSYESIERN